ncbi:MAG: hypothetical protein WCF04_11470 [Candidatus Nanopelagicales bacterium]
MPERDHGRGRTPRWVLVWVLTMAAVITAPVWSQPGFVLTHDCVAVPGQDLLPWMWGAGGAPPRSVPQDAIVAVLDDVVPGHLLQRAMIVGSLILLGTGVAGLLRVRPAFDQAAAATVAMWSAYVFQRSVMGHWGLLIGLASLPWVLSAAQDVRVGQGAGLGRLAGWTVLGSLVPTAGALQAGAATVVLGWPRPPSRWRAVRGVVVVLLVQLVWVVPGLGNPGVPSQAAAEAFGARGEGAAGPLLTILGTAGIWNAAATAPSRAGPMSVIAPLVLVGLAALGLWRLRSVPGPIVAALAVLSAAGLTWALASALTPMTGLVVHLESLPGGGLLRDAQKWLAPWVVLLSLAAGAGLGRIRERARGSDGEWPVGVLLLAVPLLLLPDAAFGAMGRIQPVTYPEVWERVRTALLQAPDSGDVVSLPWSAMRAYDWNEHRTVLDPAPRYLPRPVVTDSRLLVAEPDGLVVIPPDDPHSVAVAEALLAPDVPRALRDLGVGWVLWQEGQQATPGFPAELPESVREASALVVDSPGLSLYRLDGAVEPVRQPAAWLALGWIAWLLAVAAALGGIVQRARRSTARRG